MGEEVNHNIPNVMTALKLNDSPGNLLFHLQVDCKYYWSVDYLYTLQVLCKLIAMPFVSLVKYFIILPLFEKLMA